LSSLPATKNNGYPLRSKRWRLSCAKTSTAEVLVVNDGSTDSTGFALKAFADLGI